MFPHMFPNGEPTQVPCESNWAASDVSSANPLLSCVRLPNPTSGAINHARLDASPRLADTSFSSAPANRYMCELVAVTPGGSAWNGGSVELLPKMLVKIGPTTGSCERLPIGKP